MFESHGSPLYFHYICLLLYDLFSSLADFQVIFPFIRILRLLGLPIFFSCWLSTVFYLADWHLNELNKTCIYYWGILGIFILFDNKGYTINRSTRVFYQSKYFEIIQVGESYNLELLFKTFCLAMMKELFRSWMCLECAVS